MAINFPSNPALDDLFTDSSNVEWKCIDATAGDVQWARTGFNANVDVAPIGSILAWPNAIIPAGWLECNGQATAAFPDLAAVIGANVPDLRGEFIRGFDNGRGVDTGRILGSAQADEFKSHTHTMYNDVGASSGTARRDLRAGSTVNDLETTATGGAETRPRNIALIYIIKAYNAVTTTQGILFPNKNYIINPTFTINQRGFAGGSLALGVYGFDRWVSGLDGLTVSLPDANGFVTLSDHHLYQFIENLGVEGVMTLSWEGTATGGVFGDGQGAGMTSPYTLDTTGFWNQGADANALNIIFKNGTLKNVKLEIGSVSTPFEYPDIGTELAKCLRYYEETKISIRLESITLGNGADKRTLTIQPKRIGGSIVDTSSMTTGGAVTIDSAIVEGTIFNVVVFNTTHTGDAFKVIDGSFSINAEL